MHDYILSDCYVLNVIQIIAVSKVNLFSGVYVALPPFL